MAEERIRILTSKDPCKNCKVKPCTRKCIFGQLYEKAPGITRQEAIERIGNALWEEGLKEGADYYAKVALNALLEGK